jgi:hypothetical protein
LRPRGENDSALDDRQARREADPPQARPEVEPARDIRGAMIVTGRVLGRNGRPLAGARVAVVAGEYRQPGAQGPHAPSGKRVLRSGASDDQGRFSLALERPSEARHFGVSLLMAAPGHAPSWQAVSPRDSYHEAQEVQCELEPGQLVRGRLVDADGIPAAGVQAHVVGLVKRSRGSSVMRFRGPPAGLAPWPAAVTTDNAGRFQLRDIGPDCEVDLQVLDNRFAPQWVILRTGPNERPEEATLALTPRRVLQGVVTRADTGLALANARLFATSSGPGAASLVSMTESQTDAQGRFQLAPFPGQELVISAYPPVGSPYLVLQHSLRWDPGIPRREVSFALPRGVGVRGQVVEIPSGRAVPGAAIEYRPRTGDNPHVRTKKDGPIIDWGSLGARSGPDGTFQITVLPGPGWLLCKGPGRDYLHVEVSAGQIEGRTTGGMPFFPDALIPLDPKPNGDMHKVRATLHRGVTLSGQVLTDDGRPAATAFLLAPTYLPRGFAFRGDALPVYNGRFELPGCDPERSVPIVFYDTRRLQGAFIELSPKPAGGKQHIVRLAPCGLATARCLDSAGRPLLRPAAQLDLLLRPGATIQESFDRNVPAYITVPAGRFFGPQCTRLDPRAGTLSFSCLIPGATYLVQADEGRGLTRKATFTIQPGQKRALPDIVFKATR